MPIYKMEGRKNGKQRYRVRVNYIDDSGVARSVERVVYGIQEAKDLEAFLLNDIKKPKLTKTQTVAQLISDYLNSKKHEVRETSLDKTRRTLEYHVVPILGTKRLSAITLQTLKQWKQTINEKKLSSTTKKNIFGELRALLNYAVRMEYINSHPLNKLGNFKDAYETKKTINYYTVEEFKKFIEKAKEFAETSTELYEWNYFVFFNIAFYTGMRKGEINALRWSDIESNTIHVRRSIAQKVKGDDKETPPKNKSSYRDVQIPLPLMKILDDHKARQALAHNFTTDWRVCGMGDKCLRDTSITNRSIQFAKAAGVKIIRIHDFRHSHATLLANNGINIQEIARRLGHSKIEITWNIYSHLYPKEEERALKILNEIE